jgi:hypothetical protein
MGEAWPFFLAGGGKIVKSTSGGIDNGARPICDARYVDTENDREEMEGNAGTRNEGKETEGAKAIALSNPFDLAVESIADVLQG